MKSKRRLETIKKKKRLKKITNAVVFCFTLAVVFVLDEKSDNKYDFLWEILWAVFYSMVTLVINAFTDRKKQ